MAGVLLSLLPALGSPLDTLSAGYSSLMAQFIARVAPQPKPSTACILGNCATRIASCFADHDCRSGLVCTAGCAPNDNACIFKCTSDFEDHVYDSLIRCFFTTHDCMRMPKNETYSEWEKCRSVDDAAPMTSYLGQPLTVATARKLLSRGGTDRGYWLVAQGLSHAYDCFDCQNLWFYQNQSGSEALTYSAIYKIHKSNGDSRWNRVRDPRFRGGSARGTTGSPTPRMSAPPRAAHAHTCPPTRRPTTPSTPRASPSLVACC